MDLLVNNFQESDWKLLENLTQQKLDIDEHHQLQINVTDLFKKHPSKEAAGALINLLVKNSFEPKE